MGGWVSTPLVWNLFSGAFWFNGNKDYKVVIIGLDNAGKTTILYRLLEGTAVQVTPTIGSNVEEFTYKNVKLLMWDIGGQKTIRNTWSTYYVHTHAVFVVVDSSDRERLSIVQEELEKLLSFEALQTASLLVFANKMDVKGAMTSAEICEKLKLPQLLANRSWNVRSCCALTGQGLFEGLDWLLHELSASN